MPKEKGAEWQHVTIVEDAKFLCASKLEIGWNARKCEMLYSSTAIFV